MVETVTKFDESFFEEEERCGFIITKERKELWAIELDILNELMRICRKYNIKFFLEGGALLGAVRDGKFIPWDDDIDVTMERKEYEKLLLHVDEFNECFFFQTTFTDKNYFHGISQIRRNGTCYMLGHEAKCADFHQGIFLDIFVLDGLPNDTREAEKFFKRKDKYFLLLSAIAFRKRETNFFRIILRNSLCFFALMLYGSMDALYKKYDMICQQYSGSSTEFWDYISFHRTINQAHYFKLDWYNETEYVKFENLMVPIPKGYRYVLKELFGSDYMTPVRYNSCHQVTGGIIDTGRSYMDVLSEI